MIKRGEEGDDGKEVRAVNSLDDCGVSFGAGCSSVAYNSVTDNGDNNSVCSLRSQECRGQMIPHHDDGGTLKNSERRSRKDKKSKSFVRAL